MENGNIILWKPTKKQVTNIEKFRREINRKYQLNLENYKELWKWSVVHHVHFWKEFWIFSSLKYSQIYKSVVETEKDISEIPEWFSGSRLNFAENLLCRGKDSDIALYVTGENETVKKITYLELRTEVAHLATALKNNGVQIGDRVVGYVPNCELAVIAMLATSSIGAVWSSTSPEFGVSGVLDRFKQIHPKIIFSVEAVVYNGKTHNHLEKLKSVVEGLPDLKKVVLYPFVNKEAEIDISQIPRCVTYKSFIGSCDETPSLDYQQLPFNHPLYIMYSSGTTGPPKCMVHSAGGALIQHLKEHMLHGNLSSEDILMYYTTTGWMMWNWMVSSLAVGASIVCYDGSPLLPKPDVLWDLVDSIGITVLGCGARWIEALEEKSINPINTHNLASLHTILSTGSPLKPESFDYVYTHIKKDIMLGSITGGTDIISCFAGQNPTLPVYRGEIQSSNLGMAVHCFNKNGESVTDKPGELVCTKPFPSMPTNFWNDANSAKYQKSYFEKFPGVWCHGDYCQINSTTGGIVMLGRSDGVLNPNGVRFGSAEIYNVVMSHTVFPEISDALCVGQVATKGERVVLFLKITNGFSFSEDLRRKVRSEIRSQLSARHVPEKILETPAIPYTASGKKVEIAVKKIINGEPVEKRGALVNPESLDFYFNLADLSL